MMENVPMRHLIERVLELSDEEQRVVQREPAPDMGSEEELKALLESLQPRIRVYGVGGAGCNAINRLFDEQLFESSYVTGLRHQHRRPSIAPIAHSRKSTDRQDRQRPRCRRRPNER